MTYAFSLDPQVVRSFYELLKSNMVLPMPSADGEKIEWQRTYMDLDLFSMRGEFLGCVVCKVDQRTAGVACLTRYDGYAHIDSAYVATQHRGRGVGVVLITMARDKLLEMRAVPIHVTVRSTVMDHLIDKLNDPAGTFVKDHVAADLDTIRDCLFTDDEEPPE